ncbi:MAG: helix-hairpin-helix domain-containing protein [Bacteroidetes bacterium]|nr:helix-hairpin-helix domain-containing protein [Fibrella sp.]
MFNRFQSLIRDYFGVSHRESRGFIVLIGLTCLFLAYPFISRFFTPDTKASTSVADQRKLDSLVALMKTEENAPRNRYASRDRDESDKSTAERFSEPKLFKFNPNTVGVAQWQQLGLPKWMAERIDKYRSKGGQFRKKEDLLKIYDFPADLYDQLEPYIQLPAQTSPAYASRTPDGRQNGPSADGYPSANAGEERRYPANNFPARPAYVKPVIVAFDINTADTTQLAALKGIGAGRARQIIKFRDALGGFASTTQFGEIFNIDSLSLSELEKYGRIDTPVRKISINTASPEVLDRSPYLSRRQAEVIINYRTQHGAFTSAEALRPIRILDAKLIEKLTPYLSFD